MRWVCWGEAIPPSVLAVSLLVRLVIGLMAGTYLKMVRANKHAMEMEVVMGLLTRDGLDVPS